MDSRWFVVLWTRVRLIECQRFVELGVHISAGILPDRRRDMADVFNHDSLLVVMPIIGEPFCLTLRC